MRNGTHTLRGTISLPQIDTRRCALFNGSWTKNFKVVSVNIFASNITNNDTILILHFDEVVKTSAEGKDNAQFGWATTDALAQDWSYVDPDHIIVDDMFISAISAAPGEVNYVIKLERVTTSLSEAILDQVKAKLQS